MTKPVTGQEGNLGKRVARQERNLRKRVVKAGGKTGKRVAREKCKHVAGGMATGRMATRTTELLKPVEVSVNGDATEKLKRKEKEDQDLLSCSENDDLHVMFYEWAKKHEKEYSSNKEREKKFEIFRASKKLVDEHNSLNLGSTLTLNSFAGVHVQCGAGSHRAVIPSYTLMSNTFVDCTGTDEEESEELKEAKEGQDLLSCSENDQLLRVMFDEWAEEIGKTYSSERVREERFQIFCASKKLVDEHNSLNHGPTLELYWFSDMEVQCGVVPSHTLTDTSEEESEELKEAEEDLDHLSCDLHTLFDKWTKKYGIRYSSEEEQKERFDYFCATKQRIDNLNSLGHGSREYGLNECSDRQRGHGYRFFGRPGYEYDYPKPKEENEESKEARLVFDQWAKDHGKKYRNKGEREKRFWIFFDSKKRIDEYKERLPSCWTYGYVKGMDLMHWEKTKGKGRSK